MNSIDENYPQPSSVDKNSPAAINSSQPQSYPKEDELFVIKPPEKKPLDKKSIFFAISLSVIGVILLLVVLVFALIGSASGLANDYRRLALDQIIKLDKPLSELKPSAVLNKRNLDASSKAIELSKQSQPSLESVLFVGAWSERYTQTLQLEKKVDAHYQHIETYKKEVTTMIAFDNALSEMFAEEPNLNATVNPANSLSIRSASGSYAGFAKKINEEKAPPQLKNIQNQLVEVYQKKSEIYTAWALLVEAGNMGGEAQAKADLVAESAKTVLLMEDENFILSLQPSYEKLTDEHAALKNQLAT